MTNVMVPTQQISCPFFPANRYRFGAKSVDFSTVVSVIELLPGRADELLSLQGRQR